MKTLSKTGVRNIRSTIEILFDGLKGRLLGPDFIRNRGDKNVFIGYRPEFSLPGIYRGAAAEEATRHDPTVLNGLVKVAEGYLDAQCELTKAKVIHAVNAWLAVSKKDKPDVMTVLEGELAPIWKQMSNAVTKIVESEATGARNLGTLEGIVKINGLRGISDATVAFIGPNDDHTCGECKRVLYVDGVIPRVFKLSQVSHDYHVRGSDTPSMSGMHPVCRHSLVTLLPGYGFDRNGRIVFVSLDYDVLANQAG